MAVEIAVLREVLRYEPDTGLLFWRERPRRMFPSDRLWNAFNRKYAGKEAFTAISQGDRKTGGGYRRGIVNGRSLKAHRVIWAIVHGEWPKGDVDHINHDRADNRILNLREVDRMTNARNAELSRANVSGRTGVCYHHASGYWVAQWNNGPMRVQVSFDTFEQAVEARERAEKRLGYHENHGKALAA